MASKDSLPIPKQEQQKESYAEWAKKHYNNQYETWVPWMEDQYLRWFTKDNKTSYATKQQLDKSKVTGISQVDQVQDGVNNLVAGQLQQGGLAQPISDMSSKEGVNRVERGGKGDDGSWVPEPVGNAGAKLGEGAKGLGGAVGGVFGDGKK